MVAAEWESAGGDGVTALGGALGALLAGGFEAGRIALDPVAGGGSAGTMPVGDGNGDGAGMGIAGSTASPVSSQYFAAVLMRVSAAIKKTPDVATTSPECSPSRTSYIPFASSPTRIT